MDAYIEFRNVVKKFDDFVAIAVFLTWLGQKLGLPLYLAAVLVFGTRMFQNFAEIRRELLTSKQKRAKISQDIVRDGEDGTK